MGGQSLDFGSAVGFGAGISHATVVTTGLNETSSCQTRFSGRWRPQGEQLKDGIGHDRHCVQCSSGAFFFLATSGQRNMKSRGINTTQRQRSSCRPPHECVFGATPQTLHCRPTRRLGSIGTTFAASSTPSQVYAFSLVLSDSSDRMSEAFDQKMIWCSESASSTAPFHDMTRNDIRDLILGGIQASWIRLLANDYPDDTFYLAQDQTLVQKPQSSECCC